MVDLRALSGALLAVGHQPGVGASQRMPNVWQATARTDLPPGSELQLVNLACELAAFTLSGQPRLVEVFCERVDCAAQTRADLNELQHACVEHVVAPVHRLAWLTTSDVSAQTSTVQLAASCSRVSSCVESLGLQWRALTLAAGTRMETMSMAQGSGVTAAWWCLRPSTKIAFLLSLRCGCGGDCGDGSRAAQIGADKQIDVVGLW